MNRKMVYGLSFLNFMFFFLLFFLSLVSLLRYSIDLYLGKTFCIPVYTKVRIDRPPFVFIESLSTLTSSLWFRTVVLHLQTERDFVPHFSKRSCPPLFCRSLISCYLLFRFHQFTQV